jgi:hypothetical protein
VRTEDQIGVPESRHPLTHHQGNPEKMAKCAEIQRYHIALFTEYVEKLSKTPDGDGSLLDHSVLLFGSGIRPEHEWSAADVPGGQRPVDAGGDRADNRGISRAEALRDGMRRPVRQRDAISSQWIRTRSAKRRTGHEEE